MPKFVGSLKPASAANKLMEGKFLSGSLTASIDSTGQGGHISGSGTGSFGFLHIQTHITGGGDIIIDGDVSASSPTSSGSFGYIKSTGGGHIRGPLSVGAGFVPTTAYAATGATGNYLVVEPGGVAITTRAESPIGATGPQGIQGGQGFTGPQGGQGHTGVSGQLGNTGHTGPQGVAGNPWAGGDFTGDITVAGDVTAENFKSTSPEKLDITSYSSYDIALNTGNWTNALRVDDGTRCVAINNSAGNGSYEFYVSGKVASTDNIVAFVSDKRLKENFLPISDSLSKIKQLSGVTFNWNDKGIDLSNNMKDKNKREVGLIAQEVEKILPEAVVNWDEDNNDYKSVLYDRLVPLLIEGMKEQQEQIEKLQERVDKLDGEK